MATRFDIEEGGLALPLDVLLPRAIASAGSARKLSRCDLWAYGLAGFAPGLLTTPMTSYVPQLYAKNFGIGLASLGAALTTLRIANAVTDQIVGQLSDATRTRWGSRKPWIVVGGALSLIAAFFLFQPPPMVSLFYLVAWKALYDLSYAISDVTYTAWGAELSTNYDTRTRVTGMRALFFMIGNLANDVVPIVVFWIGLTASSAYSFETMHYFFLFALVAVPLTTAYALARAPKGRALPAERPNISGFVRSVRGNKPLWLYVVSFTLSGFGFGSLQIMFTFYDGYLHLGQWYPYLMTLFAVTMTLCVPVWTKICGKLGKHHAFFVAMAIGSLSMQGYWFIDPVHMATRTVVVISLAVVIVMGSGASALFVISPSILGDIADYGRLRTGKQRTGGYYAFYQLTYQCAVAIGAGGSFMLLAAFGYDARAGAINSDWARLGMMLTATVIPAVFKIGGATLMLRFPIDKRRHAIIQRRLAQRDARALRNAGLAAL